MPRPQNIKRMKAKKGFKAREICGETIVVPEGEENIDFSNIIKMNETAVYLWKAVQNRDAFSMDDLVDLLLEDYEVDRQQAAADVKVLVSQWAQAGIIEGDDIPEIPASKTTDRGNIFRKIFS